VCVKAVRKHVGEIDHKSLYHPFFVNFTMILQAAFARPDPKNVRRQSRH